jgi:hypothetical protein
MSISKDHSGSQAHGPHRQFSRPVACRCGQSGIAIWEDDFTEGKDKPRPVLIEVSGGFYIRISKKDVAINEIACLLCERTVGLGRRRTIR